VVVAVRAGVDVGAGASAAVRVDVAEAVADGRTLTVTPGVTDVTTVAMSSANSSAASEVGGRNADVGLSDPPTLTVGDTGAPGVGVASTRVAGMVAVAPFQARSGGGCTCRPGMVGSSSAAARTAPTTASTVIALSMTGNMNPMSLRHAGCVPPEVLTPLSATGPRHPGLCRPRRRRRV